jgi:2-polyprenyl-3-methyl-5-hydroxy-6-metoxy-1,4-benzoquinol methylase
VTGALIEIRDCQVCGSDQHRLMFEDEPYRVVRCVECSLVFVTPRVADEHVGAIYDENYWRSERPRDRGYADYARDEPLYLKTFERRMRFVERWVRPHSKVLDIGCAAGFFLRVMRERGHDVRGLELSSAIARIAHEHLGEERVFVGALEDLPADASGFERGSFDLVTMWDVLEHVPDPQSLLRHARAMLRPGGTLILETQNVDSRFAQLLGRRWQHYKHQEHLYHFNPATIARLLQQEGWEVISNTPRFGGKYVSLGFIAERAGRLSPAAAFLLKPLHLLGRANLYVNLRDEMVVVARPAATARGRAEVDQGRVKTGT